MLACFCFGESRSRRHGRGSRKRRVEQRFRRGVIASGFPDGESALPRLAGTKKFGDRQKEVWNACNPLKFHKTAKGIFGNPCRKQAFIWKSLTKTNICLEKSLAQKLGPAMPRSDAGLTRPASAQTFHVEQSKNPRPSGAGARLGSSNASISREAIQPSDYAQTQQALGK